MHGKSRPLKKDSLAELIRGEAILAQVDRKIPGSWCPHGARRIWRGATPDRRNHPMNCPIEGRLCWQILRYAHARGELRTICLHRRQTRPSITGALHFSIACSSKMASSISSGSISLIGHLAGGTWVSGSIRDGPRSVVFQDPLSSTKNPSRLRVEAPPFPTCHM
jgi:hypothetical protein